MFTASYASDYLTVSAVGDIMMGSAYPEPLLPIGDGKGIFNGVSRDLHGSDIVFGNIEGPLADRGKPVKCKGKRDKQCYEFRTPRRYAARLKEAGFNAVSIANNHASDFGPGGIESTISALDAAGIHATGGNEVARLDIQGRHVAIAGFSFSSSASPCSILDISGAAKIVGDLKKSSDIVIVSFHGGAEGKSAGHVTGKDEFFLGENRGNVMAFARAVVDAGADLVIGHGPHVLRAIEVYRGKLIAYSLGNFLTYGRFNTSGPNGLSVILKVRLDAKTGGFAGGELIPIKLSEEGIPRIDEGRESINLIKLLTLQDLPDGNLTIGDDGTLK